MDLIESWSVRLASEVAPSEAELAPLMTEAYVQGGAARKTLFAYAESGPLGGFGPAAGVAFFPWVLQSIAAAAPVIAAMLSAIPHLKDFLAALKDGLDIHDRLQAEEKKVTAEHPYAPLRRALDALSQNLANTPVPEEQREVIAYRVLRAFLEEPAQATEFVQKVGAVARG